MHCLTMVGLLSTLMLPAPAPAPSPAPETGLASGTIRVVSEATVVVKPDLAILSLGVTTDKPSAGAATTENARKMQQIIEVLKKEVGAGGEVQTAGYQVSPRFGEERPGGTRLPIVAYTVTNTVRVRIPDVNAVGRLMDAAFKAGANTVEQVEFTLKNPEPAQSEALRAAAAKARARAQAMAAALGLRVAHVVSISEGDSGPGPLPHARMALSANAGTPIEAGGFEVRATVTVVFAIGGR